MEQNEKDQEKKDQKQPKKHKKLSIELMLLIFYNFIIMTFIC